MKDLTRETIDRIIELAPATVLEIDGRRYSDRTLISIKPPQEETMKLHSLDGLVAFHQTSNVENVKIVVESPTCVKLIGAVQEPWKTYTVYVSSECYPFNFSFGTFYQQEEFVIKLMTQFSRTGQFEKTLGLVGNVSLEHGTKLQDDGCTQTVIVKKGARFENEAIFNPELAPLRTFTEIDPLLSRFVLRHRDGTFALFDSEGEKWKYVVIKEIVSYLKNKTPELTILY